MSSQPAPRASASVLASAMRIFDLSLGQMLWSRRSVFLGLLLGAPVLLAVILRIVDTLHTSGFRINGAAVGGSTVFGMMIWLLFIRFIVPVLGVFYGTALIADEVEDKTITYLFTRPIPRRAVLFGKYLAYVACTVLLFPGYLKRLTVAYYLQALVTHEMPQDSAVSMLLQVFHEVPSVATSLMVLAAIIAVALWLSGQAVEQREYVLEQ
jgi:ABC-type transport system involved in multi-copper enzyme maturation permease subunit